MSIPSLTTASIAGTRRVPQQQRGERRVAALLHAAACEIAHAGYDGATMSGIAERAGACIGSLYQFFPNKESVTAALQEQYGRDLRILWSSLEASQSMSMEVLVGHLVAEMIRFLDDRPAVLPLLNSPCNKSHDTVRKVLRSRLARILVANLPVLSKSTASVRATVVLQILKAMNELYAEASKSQRRSLVAEFELALVGYLKSSVGASKWRKRKEMSHSYV